MKKNVFWPLTLVALALAAGSMQSCTQSRSQESPLKLSILHINDTHAHFDSEALRLNLAGETTRTWLGGYDRLGQLIAEKRAAFAARDRASLLLHGGDAFQGTLYFNKYAGKIDAEVMNYLKFDAMTLGNHEFDKGPEPLGEFLDLADFPVLAANVDARNEPSLAGKLPAYVIKKIRGVEVAIVGMVPEDTAVISQPGDNVVIEAEVVAARRVVAELKRQGIEHIIFLTHIGLAKDLILAERVAEIDVIVGGHSHSLLGDFGALGLATEHPYPVVQGDTCIVQAWQWTWALGSVDVEFDRSGDVVRCEGSPELVMEELFQRDSGDGGGFTLVSEAVNREIKSFVSQQPHISLVGVDHGLADLLQPYRQGVEEFRAQQVAVLPYSLPHLAPTADGGKGSLLAPFIAQALQHQLGMGGQPLDGFLQNAGGVRVPILEQGAVSVARVVEVLPFENTLVRVTLSGAQLKQEVAAAVARGGGAFPYLSGFQYSIAVAGEVDGQVQWRLVELYHGEGVVDPETEFTIGMSAFLAGGGDHYDFSESQQLDTGLVDNKQLIDYLQQRQSWPDPVFGIR